MTGEDALLQLHHTLMEVVHISISLETSEDWRKLRKNIDEVFAFCLARNGFQTSVLADISRPRQMPLDLQAEPQADQVPADMFM